MDRNEIQRLIGIARAKYGAGDLPGASALTDQVLATIPGEPNAHYLRALLRRAAGDSRGALAAVDHALSAAPNAAPMHVLRGDLLLELDDTSSALAAFDRASASGLAHPAVWSGRGVALMRQGLAEEAIACFEQCLRHNSKDADAHYNRARALQALDRLSEALTAYDAALALRPDDAAMHHNRAVLLQWMDRRVEALDAFDAALRIHPERYETLYSKGVALMAFGDYQRGWPLMELRLRAGIVPHARNHARGEPQWRGERLDGPLRVWPEQGIGDEVLFARLAPLTAMHTDQVVLECAARLQPLFARAFPGLLVRSLEEGERASPATAQIAIGSLGVVLNVGSEDLRGASFLKANADQTRRLRARYEAQARGRKIVGISWRSTNAALGPHKSTSLADWGALLRSDALFVDLQYGDTLSDRDAAQAAFGCDIFRDGEVDQLTDLDAFAAQIAAMDSIISVSNTTVHMAGALGAPCVVLAPPAQGLLWYWGSGGARTPWYDSVTIERRGEGEPWSAQIARAAARFNL